MSEPIPDYSDAIGDLLRREIQSIRDFHSAPILTGRAVEKVILHRLRQFLPSRIELGSGSICYRSRVSGEMDIILFDRQMAPVFGSGANRIYPCEGVVAVIEVKSKLDKRRLVESFRQVRSIRAMRRPSWETNGRDRVDAYVVGAESVKLRTLANHHVQLVNQYREEDQWLLEPTVVVSLAEGVLAPCATLDRVHYGPGPNGHAGVAPIPSDILSPFSYLVRSLWFSWSDFIGQHGAPYNDYFGPFGGETLKPIYFKKQRPPDDALFLR